MTRANGRRLAALSFAPSFARSFALSLFTLALFTPAIFTPVLFTPAMASGAEADTASADQRSREAIEAYRNAMSSRQRDQRLGHFRRAERLFAAAAAEAGAPSADLFANLGNAALQGERLGAAVLAYRRALALEPDHERAGQNLQHTRGLLPDWVPSPPDGGVLDSFFFWHRSLSRDARTAAAAGAFALTLLCLSLSIALRMPMARYLALPAGAAWIALVVSLVFDPARGAEHEGVVVGREVLARAADSINAASRFGEPLPPGTEVKILEDRGGWLQIELHNGRNAWVTSSAVERIAAPAVANAKDEARIDRGSGEQRFAQSAHR